MTETFKVGDVVELNNTRRERGTVDHIYTSAASGRTMHVVKLDDGGKSYLSDVEGMTRVLTTFEHGARVVHTSTGDAVSVVRGGPFLERYDGSSWYVVENADGSHETSAARYLSAAPEPEPAPIKVGDRVRILEASHAEFHHGRTAMVTRTDGTWRSDALGVHPYVVRLDSGGTLHVKRVERLEDEPANVFVHNGVTYDLDATYRDKDGDRWQFGGGLVHADGAPIGSMNGVGYQLQNVSLIHAANRYGPLTRFTDR